MTDTPLSPQTQSPVRFKLDPSVTFVARRVGDESRYVARHSQSGKYYELGHDEFAVANLVKDWHCVSEILASLGPVGINWSGEELAGFIAMLVNEKILLTEHPSAAVAAVPTSRFQLKQVLAMLSFSISQRVPLFHADALAEAATRRVGWMFGASGFWLWCAIVLSGGLIATAHRVEMMGELRRIFDLGLWPVLAVMWCASKVVHEFGHAVAAKRQGVRVGNMGVMFFLFAPLAYVDVTDAWRLPGRFARAKIAMAGVYVELAVAAIAMWCYMILPEGLGRHLCAQVFVIAGPATLLVNANPLLRLDGYYVFSDLTDIANLRMHGRRSLVSWVERILFGIPRPTSMLGGWRRSVAMMHALASVAFQVVWMSGLVFAIATWAKGIGVALAIVAILLWCVLPLARWIWRIWWITPSIGQRRRLVMLVLTFAMMGEYAVMLPSPVDRRVPVVVRHHQEQIARAGAGAFVSAVWVEHGQQVEQGTMLVELDAPELRNNHATKADELESAELQAVQLRRQGELALAAAESERAASLKRQLIELADQVASLQVTATRSGIVLRPDIQELVGQYVRPGDEILRVGDPREMELLISVAESDTGAYEQACQRQEKIAIRLRGGRWIEAQPVSLRPRARVSLPHPALASTVGGPLAVEPDQQSRDGVRLIAPRSETVVKLDPLTSSEVRSGQVGSMTIADVRPLVTRLIAWLNNE